MLNGACGRRFSAIVRQGVREGPCAYESRRVERSVDPWSIGLPLLRGVESCGGRSIAVGMVEKWNQFACLYV